MKSILRAGAVLAAAFFVVEFASAAMADEIQSALSGRTAFESGKAYRPWRQYFAADGTTIYFGDGPSAIGKWEVRGKQFCSLWPPTEDWACYDVELSASNAPSLSIVWVSKDGTREGANLFDGNQTALRSPPRR